MKHNCLSETTLRMPSAAVLLSCCGLPLNLAIVALPLLGGSGAPGTAQLLLFFVSSTMLYLADQTRLLSGHGPEPPAEDGPYQHAALCGGILLLLLQWTSLTEFLCSEQRLDPASITGLSGFLLVITGSLLRTASIRALGDGFRSDRANQRLVTDSVFQYLRHPSETGLLLACSGMPLILGSWKSAAVLLPLILAASVVRVRLEEAWLQADFGEGYMKYQSGTGRWMPRLPGK